MTTPQIWLAPLHGITSYTFRNILCRHFGGIDCFMSPFLPTQSAGKFRQKVWQDIAPANNTALPLVPQLMGNRPDHFVDTVRMLNEQFGYEHFNINIGCPSSPVVRHTRGCGLMPHPDIVEQIVAEVTGKTPFRISLKMRLGLHSINEGRKLLTHLNDYPLDFLVIHPRLGDDLYEGVPDWDTFAEFCQLTQHKIVYSGDIFTVEDYNRLSERFPQVAAWMLGRGLLRNPFLAEEIKGQDIGDKRERFLNFYQDFIEKLLPIRGESGTLANLKELWHYFAVFTGLSEEKLQQLLRICDLREFVTVSS
ncbi:MAG: tRNA-dihydrouridine synthase family protein [Bacteroidales bacterium]|nr:tRNA-dihydrouridine synthase family protein [Bacteroidales bacterium]